MGTHDPPPELVALATIDLPVREASGAATRLLRGRVRVMVVGDLTAHVAAADVGPDGELGEWQHLDLAGLPGWPVPARNSQFEAIAADGGRLVALMTEDPPAVFVGETVTRELRAEIALVAPPGSPLHGKWDDASSRGEGLVLLRGGRLLVAKEKRPRALVEFGPAGSAARGVSRDDFLGSDESWDAPEGRVEYEALAMWRLKGAAKEALEDVSALAVGADRSLWLLSDKSCALARLSLESPLAPDDDEIRELDELWRLPEGTEKPEGIVALDDRRLLVVMDTKEARDNGLIVERPGVAG
jgi:hypothetical protein